MNIIQLPLGEVHPYKNNPRKNDGAVDAVAESIRQYGFLVPLVISADHEIITGHTRFKAAKKLGLSSVPCVIADELTEEQIKAFRLVDNKVGELAEWVKEMKIERLGCFAYSQEEGTPAALLDGQLDLDEKQRRADIIMETQLRVHERYCQKMVGKTVEILVEGFDKYAECFFGRGEADAPDIDGKIFFSADKPLAFGDEVCVTIEEALEYDLIGSLVE